MTSIWSTDHLKGWKELMFQCFRHHFMDYCLSFPTVAATFKFWFISCFTIYSFQNTHQFLIKDVFYFIFLDFALLFFFSDMPKPPEDDAFILPDEYKLFPRNKRAVLMKNQHGRELNVEMLVVVDRQMMDNHGHENITTYVLTVLNMVRTDTEFCNIKTKLFLYLWALESGALAVSSPAVFTSTISTLNSPLMQSLWSSSGS